MNQSLFLDGLKIMNNEPVAWIDKNTGKPRMEGFIQTDYDIPLYLHPADRIAELEQALENIIAISDRKHDAWDKAKELLKKASEK